MEFKFENGDYVEEFTTGFMGNVICRSDWGCGRKTYTVQPKSPNGSRLPKAQEFDEDFLKVIEDN